MSFTELEAYFIGNKLYHYLNSRTIRKRISPLRMGYKISEQTIYIYVISYCENYGLINRLPIAKLSYARGIDAWCLFKITKKSEWLRYNEIAYPELKYALFKVTSELECFLPQQDHLVK